MNESHEPLVSKLITERFTESFGVIDDSLNCKLMILHIYKAMLYTLYLFIYSILSVNLQREPNSRQKQSVLWCCISYYVDRNWHYSCVSYALAIFSFPALDLAARLWLITPIMQRHGVLAFVPSSNARFYLFIRLQRVAVFHINNSHSLKKRRFLPSLFKAFVQRRKR